MAKIRYSIKSLPSLEKSLSKNIKKKKKMKDTKKKKENINLRKNKKT